MFRNPQDLLLLMGTEILKIDAPWAEKLTKTRVQFFMTPTVFLFYNIGLTFRINPVTHFT